MLNKVLNFFQHKEIRKVRVALALGGGGARGIAHLGVLEELENNNIPIDLIVGTSAGSIVGALYADKPNIRHVKKLLINIRRKDLMEFSWLSALQFLTQVKAPYSGESLNKFITKNADHTNIEDFQIPFVAVASDLDSGKPYLFTEGPAGIAVQSSSALPPVFTPVIINGKHLVDGGILEPVPVHTAKMYDPVITIAVNVTANSKNKSLNNMFNVTYKSAYHMYYHFAQMQSEMADIVIHPDLTGFNVLADGHNQTIFKKGKESAKLAIPSILTLLKERGIA